MVGLPELRHSYQHRQKSVEGSVLACRNKVRLRIRSFWWQKAKLLLALWFVCLFSFLIFCPDPGCFPSPLSLQLSGFLSS